MRPLFLLPLLALILALYLSSDDQQVECRSLAVPGSRDLFMSTDGSLTALGSEPEGLLLSGYGGKKKKKKKYGKKKKKKYGKKKKHKKKSHKKKKKYLKKKYKVKKSKKSHKKKKSGHKHKHGKKKYGKKKKKKSKKGGYGK